MFDYSIKDLKTRNEKLDHILDEINRTPQVKITINKEDLSVTGDLDKLIFDNDDKSEIVTKNNEAITLTKKAEDGKVSYKVTDYKEKYSDGNSIEDTETIKDKLFHKGSRTQKDITFFSQDKLNSKFNTLFCIASKATSSNVMEL